MSDTIGDRTYGVGSQARAVLELLAAITPRFADYHDGYYHALFQTRPWYNGREQGIIISMKGDDGNALHVAVFEHKNSDRLCALTWETPNLYWNHPLENPKIFDAAYHNKSKHAVAYFVNWGDIGIMADWVYTTFKTFYGQTKKEGER